MGIMTPTSQSSWEEYNKGCKVLSTVPSTEVVNIIPEPRNLARVRQGLMEEEIGWNLPSLPSASPPPPAVKQGASLLSPRSLGYWVFSTDSAGRGWGGGGGWRGVEEASSRDCPLQVWSTLAVTCLNLISRKPPWSPGGCRMGCSDQLSV